MVSFRQRLVQNNSGSLLTAFFEAPNAHCSNNNNNTDTYTPNNEKKHGGTLLPGGYLYISPGYVAPAINTLSCSGKVQPKEMAKEMERGNVESSGRVSVHRHRARREHV